MNEIVDKLLAGDTAQKKKFSIKDFFSKCEIAFTEEIFNVTLHFLCREKNSYLKCM